ncbi:hypothetical protein LXL04_027926 [Taraxacum kok-saghyz]
MNKKDKFYGKSEYTLKQPKDSIRSTCKAGKTAKNYILVLGLEIHSNNTILNLKFLPDQIKRKNKIGRLCGVGAPPLPIKHCQLGLPHFFFKCRLARGGAGRMPSAFNSIMFPSNVHIQACNGHKTHRQPLADQMIPPAKKGPRGGVTAGNKATLLGSFENSYIPENPRTPPISYISQTVIPFKKPTSEPSKTGFETKQKTVHICTQKKFAHMQKSRSFENSYIPENPRTPKPLTFSKNRLRGAKNRSNISPVAKQISEKTIFFSQKLCICANFFFVHMSLYNTYLKRFVKKNLKKNAKKKVAHMHKK